MEFSEQQTNGAPAVSVVIPTFNRGHLLERSLHSVLVQTFSDLEVIVVDDGSTDDTERRVRAFDDPRIVYIRHEVSRGAPTARNTGIEIAKGRLIAFQDSDDIWMVDKLEKQMALVATVGSDPVVVYCGFARWNKGAITYIPQSSVSHRSGRILPNLLRRNFVSTQTILAPRQCLEEVGGFDPALRRLQDWELAIRLADRFEFRIADEPLVMVYHTTGSISTNVEAFVESLEAILGHHRAKFAAYPQHRARHLAILGHCRCATGDIAQGRMNLIEALKLRGGFARAAIGLLASLAGSSAYKALARRTMPGDMPL